ncbi:3-keto-disaccharide hydrolase [Microbacterium sp. NPDC055683]
MSTRVPLFDGRTLDGWSAVPRTYGTVSPGGPSVLDRLPDLPRDYNALAADRAAVWSVEDGAIVGRQSVPGWGGYLVSERTFGDFELELEMRPDWPADTGVMIRRRRDTWEGLQVLVDHRRSGSIGGFYGNGIGGFHGVPFAIDARLDEHGRPVGLVEDDPAHSREPITPEKRAMLARAGTVDDFLRSWRWDDWNRLRIRCTGARPVVTTWVNDVLVAEIDTASFAYPGYDPDAVWDRLGARGHIAFEVHDNDPGMGAERWGEGAACRWRNIRIEEL